MLARGGLTILHAAAYYPRVTERNATEQQLTDAAADLVGVFHGTPRQVPPSPARDLTMGQIRLLFLLEREGSLPMGRIAEVFDLSSTAATGFVTRIERHGLVERRHRSNDRRVVECALTTVGEAFLEELSGVRLDVIRSALSGLEPHELAEFRRLLGRIRESQDVLVSLSGPVRQEPPVHQERSNHMGRQT
jgi:DNA-binding MarR family transcriptional regulator